VWAVLVGVVLVVGLVVWLDVIVVEVGDVVGLDVWVVVVWVVVGVVVVVAASELVVLVSDCTKVVVAVDVMIVVVVGVDVSVLVKGAPLLLVMGGPLDDGSCRRIRSLASTPLTSPLLPRLRFCSFREPRNIAWFFEEQSDRGKRG
jgi:hypothetical protein